MTAGKHVIAYMLHLARRRSMCDVIFQMSHSPAFRRCSLIENVSLICSLNNISHHHPSFVSKNTGSLWASTFKCETGQLLCCMFFSFSIVLAKACSSFPLKSLQRCGHRSKVCFYLPKRLMIETLRELEQNAEIIFLFCLYGKQTSHFSYYSANADIFSSPVLKKLLSFVELSSSLILKSSTQHRLTSVYV